MLGSNPEAKFLVILCTCIYPEVLSPEADLRPHPTIHTHNKDSEVSSGRTAQFNIVEPRTEPQLDLG
jgi:hypothetical protein